MAYESFIAFRHLKARKKSSISVITFISILGVALGVTALVSVLSVTGGFQVVFRDKVLGLNAHVLVMKYGMEFSEYRQVMATASKVDGVKGVSPFIFHEMMLAAGSSMSGVLVKGVQPETMTSVGNLEEFMVEGDLSTLQADEESGRRGGPMPGVIIGDELADKMGVGVGDSVVLVSPLQGMEPSDWGRRSLNPTSANFQVAGIYSSGFSEFDGKLVYVNLARMQDFFRKSDVVTGVEIRVDDIFRSKEIGERVRAALGDQNYRFSTWQERHPELTSRYRLQRIVATIALATLLLLMLVAVVHLGLLLVRGSGLGKGGGTRPTSGRFRKSTVASILFLVAAAPLALALLGHTGLLGAARGPSRQTLGKDEHYLGGHLTIQRLDAPFMEYRSTIIDAQQLPQVQEAGPLIEGMGTIHRSEPDWRGRAPSVPTPTAAGESLDARSSGNGDGDGDGQGNKGGNVPVVIHGFPAHSEGIGPGRMLVEGSLEHLRNPFYFQEIAGTDARTLPVLLGEELASLLGVAVGDILWITPQGQRRRATTPPDGLSPEAPPGGGGASPRQQGPVSGGDVSGVGRGPLLLSGDSILPYPDHYRLYLAGTVRTGDPLQDSGVVFMDFVAARRILSMSDAAGAVAVQLRDPADAPRVMPMLADGLGGHAYRTLDWKELNRNLFASLDLQKRMLSLIFFVIIVVASFNIVSTLILMVLDKGREISILKSMGATDGGVMRIFILQGVTIGFIGILFGLLTGYLVCLAIGRVNWPLDASVYLIDRLPVAMVPLEFALTALVSLVICFLATILPSRMAASRTPVEGLR